MDIVKGRFIRRIFRSFEILLFFVISIVGFNVLVKSTSFNSKSKTKFFSFGTIAPRELSVPDNFDSPDNRNFEYLTGFFSSPPSHSLLSSPEHSKPHDFHYIPQHQYLSLLQISSDHKKNNPFIISSLHKPINLFQQNPVLII